MEHILLYALGAAVVAAFSTHLMVPPVTRLAIAFRALDHPGERRHQTGAVPRLGGLAIVLGLALGGSTYKLKFGHRGANQPVKDLRTGKVEITSQNHGFAVDAESLGGDVEITHINLNDNTVEGLRHREHPVFSVQYHPEASPGPHDSSYLFREFIELMEENG